MMKGIFCRAIRTSSIPDLQKKLFSLKNDEYPLSINAANDSGFPSSVASVEHRTGIATTGVQIPFKSCFSGFLFLFCFCFFVFCFLFSGFFYATANIAGITIPSFNIHYLCEKRSRRPYSDVLR